MFYILIPPITFCDFTDSGMISQIKNVDFANFRSDIKFDNFRLLFVI